MAAVDVVRAQAATSAALVATVDGFIARMWALTVTDLSQESAQRWIATVVPIVEAAKLQAARSSAVAVEATLGEQLGGPPARRAADVDIARVAAEVRQGTAPGVVYWRPVATARSYALAGATIVDALAQGQRRARTLAATDVQLARTGAAREIIAGDDRTVGHRRVLTGAESCGLCAVASTQRYHKADLMPIHPGCDCGVAPIVGDDDPGRVINQGLLDQVHDDIAARFGPDAVDRQAGNRVFDRDHPYRQMSTSFDHGEYGPTLARAGDDHLTTSAASARPGVPEVEPG